MDNPFFERGMIRDKEAFFGRREEIARILDRLRVMQSVSVVGERRIGKSSFLFHIVQTGQERLSDDYTFRYLDMQRVVTDDEFFERVVQELGGDGAGSTHRDLERAIEGKRVVLCLDEFENTADNPNFDVDFFNALRSLAQTGELALVVATQTRLSQLSYSGAIKTSPFFNIFIPLPLTPFERDEAEEMLATLSERGGHSFTGKEIRWIIEKAGMHPWHLQVLAYYFFEARQRDDPNRDEVVRRYEEEIGPGEKMFQPSSVEPVRDDPRQRLAPWVAGLVALTAFLLFFSASLSFNIGVYLALVLLAVTVGLTIYVLWPASQRVPREAAGLGWGIAVFLLFLFVFLSFSIGIYLMLVLLAIMLVLTVYALWPASRRSP